MKHTRKIFGALVILALASLVVWLPADMVGVGSQRAERSASKANAQAPFQQRAPGFDGFVSEPVTPSVTLAAADLPAAKPEYWLDREINPRMSYNAVIDPNFNPVGGPDPLLVVQESAPATQPNAFGTPLLNFNGQGYTGVNPPDTVGDVGPNHYIQMINGGAGALVQIYNKATGAPIGSQFALNDLATSGACQSGLGDPIVLYDKLSDRWLLSEFASSGNHLCIYVSTGPDPAGTYYFYDFTTPTFPDYPKYAVWPDAYYVTTNESNPTAYALNRTRMLSGLSATFQRFTAPALAGFSFQSLTPADLDGATPPPTGSPGLFIRHRDTEVHGPGGFPTKDLLEVWALSVNWTTPASSSFAKIADIQVAEFDSTLCGLTSFSCVPQPGTSVKLDPLREVVMWRLSYRNFGSRQVLVGNFTTDVNGNDRAGVRWFELRKTGTAWSLYQEGTYAPGTINRWMGGIAMDGSGNIALGYNVADSAVYPGIRYAGRLASDAPGTLPQGEHTLVNGTASNSSNRYGDYSAMSVDPSDDCTFWLTGQWNAASTWTTRIGKFKFDECGQVQPMQARAYLPLLHKVVAPTTGTVVGSVTNADTSQPLSGAEVCVLSSSQCATTNAQGAYSIASVAAGSQTMRATASGFVASQQSATVPAGGTVTVNFALTPSPTPVWTDIAVEDFEGSFPKAGWQVGDYASGYGEYYWAKRTCRPKTGSYSGWAVGGGADGTGLPCGSEYADNTFSWLIYGPFSLVGATDAEILYDTWFKSEPDFDQLFVGASIDGENFYGSGNSGDSGDWLSENFDLTAVPTLGNLTGRSSVWIAFVFTSDSSIAYPEGAYVDDIVLRKRTGSIAGQPTQSLSCDAVRQAGYVLDPCVSLTVRR